VCVCVCVSSRNLNGIHEMALRNPYMSCQQHDSSLTLQASTDLVDECHEKNDRVTSTSVVPHFKHTADKREMLTFAKSSHSVRITNDAELELETSPLNETSCHSLDVNSHLSACHDDNNESSSRAASLSTTTRQPTTSTETSRRSFNEHKQQDKNNINDINEPVVSHIPIMSSSSSSSSLCALNPKVTEHKVSFAPEPNMNSSSTVIDNDDPRTRPIVVGVETLIEIDRGTSGLGLSVVGGFDTQLVSRSVVRCDDAHRSSACLSFSRPLSFMISTMVVQRNATLVYKSATKFSRYDQLFVRVSCRSTSR
jgi:hypothetical protein